MAESRPYPAFFFLALQHFDCAVRYPDRKEEKPLWEELYQNCFKELVAYGTRMSGSRELAEDLAQETFIRALVNAGTLEDLSAGQRRAWLYRTFKNLFVDGYRRAVLEQQSVQSLQPGPQEDPGIQDVEIRSFLQIVRPEDRAIFTLRYLEGYTAREIARMLQIPEGTVRSRLSRCRTRLKQQL